MSQEEDLERRSFFRIDDEVALKYRLVSDDDLSQVDDALRINDSVSASLTNKLEKMSEVSKIHIRYVERESPEVARYFTFLEAKINLLAHHVMMTSDDFFIQSTQPVNISGSGVSFLANESYNVDDYLEVKFILSPSLTSIKTFSKVVSCKPDGAKFKIALEFNRLSDGDRDLLIRHVVKKQMNDIREQGE
jgi:hypothetical protein